MSWRLLSCCSRGAVASATYLPQAKRPHPGPPTVPLLRALWSVLDGIWGVLKGSWRVLDILGLLGCKGIEKRCVGTLRAHLRGTWDVEGYHAGGLDFQYTISGLLVPNVRHLPRTRVTIPDIETLSAPCLGTYFGPLPSTSTVSPNEVLGFQNAVLSGMFDQKALRSLGLRMARVRTESDPLQKGSWSIYLPAPPNYPVRYPKYHLIESIRPLREVHWGV